MEKPSLKEPADLPELISKSCYQDPFKMKGCFFLLFTISLLVMLQIQRGMLQTTTPAAVTTQNAASTTAQTPARATTAQAPAGTLARGPAGTTTRTTPTMRPATPFATTKKQTGAAPALSSLGSISILIVLTNTLIQLFPLS
nr:uncharacterized protein LOC123479152 [Desmodus rotundus]